MEKNILIVGVGGQGTLLASRVLGALAARLELDCKLSEVHGMSQRGGSVVTHVRMGDEIFSPIISEGDADYIIAFERLEALRWCHYLKKEGIIFINDQRIMPMPVITGMADYPDDIYDNLTKGGYKHRVIDGLGLAGAAGSTKAVNVVMLGALMQEMGISLADAEQAVSSAVPPKILDINIKALSLGYTI